MIDLMRFCLTNDVWMRMENEKQTNTNNDDEKKTYVFQMDFAKQYIATFRRP